MVSETKKLVEKKPWQNAHVSDLLSLSLFRLAAAVGDVCAAECACAICAESNRLYASGRTQNRAV